MQNYESAISTLQTGQQSALPDLSHPACRPQNQDWLQGWLRKDPYVLVAAFLGYASLWGTNVLACSVFVTQDPIKNLSILLHQRLSALTATNGLRQYSLFSLA